MVLTEMAQVQGHPATVLGLMHQLQCILVDDLAKHLLEPADSMGDTMNTLGSLLSSMTFIQ